MIRWNELVCLLRHISSLLTHTFHGDLLLGPLTSDPASVTDSNNKKWQNGPEPTQGWRQNATLRVFPLGRKRRKAGQVS